MSRVPEEPECQICYDRFDLRSRRPKRLLCGHCACARCLRRMVEPAESENALEALGSPALLSCPFCRQETPVPQREVGRLPDDATVLPLLTGPRSGPEVLLCPGGALETLPGGPLGSPSSSPSSSSDCLVVTLLELPLEGPEGSLGLLEVMRLHRPPSLGSLPCSLPLVGKCQPCLGGGSSSSSWGPQDLPRFMLGALCLAYLSSLPFGIYLLLEGHLNLGIVLVSLVPSTLILCLCYSLGQCLCQEAFLAGPSSASS
nr:E3 ubiquitin-protein ligase RNF182-like [Anolis sagrei ordinatus]